MRKIALIGLCVVLLTGCNYSEEASVEERFPDKIYVLPTADKTYLERDDEKWNELQDQLDKFQQEKAADYTYDENEENKVYSAVHYYNVRDKFYEIASQIGVVNGNGVILIENVDAQMGKEELELVSKTVGSELLDFIKSCEDLELGTFKEKRIGEYGVLVNKQRRDNTEVFIMSSDICLKDEKEMAWLDQIKGSNMLLSTVSVGEDQRLYEISDVVHAVPEFVGVFNGNSYYYQIFKDNAGKLLKVRGVIAQEKSGLNSKLLDETKLEPLQKLANELAGKEVDITKLKNSLNETIEGKKANYKGIIEGVQYNIQVNDKEYTNLIVVTLEAA